MSRSTEIGFQEGTVGNLHSLHAKQLKELTQLSSGQSLNKISDDPVKFSRVSSELSNSRQVVHFNKNAYHAATVVGYSADALKKFDSVVTRAQELSSSTSNEISTEAITSFTAEVNELLHGGVGLLNTEYMGSYLFGGTETAAPPFSTTKDAGGNILTVSYVGNSGKNEYHVSETTKIAPNTDGTDNAKLLTTMNNLISLRDAMVAKNFANITTEHSNLIARQDEIVSIESSLGAKLYRVEASIAQNSDSIDKTKLRVGEEIATDVPTAIMNLERYQTAYKAAMSVAGKVLRLSLVDMI